MRPVQGPRWRFVARGRDLRYKRPEAPRTSAPGIVKAIRRAWDEHALVDGTGQVWIGQTGLHVILRTTRRRAAHFMRWVPGRDRVAFEGSAYVRGWQVAQRIDRDIQACAKLIRSEYLALSERHYFGVRNDTEARILRLRYQESLRQLNRRLKAERIRQVGLTHDELTGEPLAERGSHFAHVLSRSVYPEYMDCVWNGVVVNPSTHDAMTTIELIDDRELVAFCVERGLATAWHPPFVQALSDAQQEM
ncbi:MAG: hypothetical protein AAGA48_19780 [Myxococcota bacterium]